MIKLPKITSNQLLIMLITSRMFSMFAYKPQRYNVGTLSAALAIAVSVLVNIAVFLPALFLLRRFPRRNISDIGYLKWGKWAGIYSIVLMLIGLFLSVECLTQFEIFMSSTIYLNAAPIFFVLPMTAVSFFICRLGIEALARMSNFVFGGLVLAIIVISLSALPKIDLIWIEPLRSSSSMGFWELVADNVAHTTEVLPFMIFASYTKGKTPKGAVLFAVIVGLLFEITSFVSRTTLGNYRETVLFPFYTVASFAENTLTERFNAAFIVLWVFMAVIKLCVYLLFAGKCLRNLFRFRSDTLPLLFCACAVVGLTLITTGNIRYADIMYGVIVSGLPILLPAILFPAGFLLTGKGAERRREKS